MEITTGGQRIHNYGQQVEKLKARGMEPEDFSGYLLFHKHGAPPHGGLGIGLERLTMQLCGLDNIRRASLFPRTGPGLSHKERGRARFAPQTAKKRRNPSHEHYRSAD